MKTTKILISLCVAGLFATTNINAQVRIGSQTTPTKGAVLDLGGTGDTYVGGLKLPNVSLTNTTSMTGLTNSETDLTKLKGLTVYNTNASITGATAKGVGIYYWDGAKWIWMQNNDASTSMNWQLGGNTVTAEQKLGTTSNFDLSFITNNTERIIVTKEGKVGIGRTPVQALDVNGFIRTSKSDGGYPAMLLIRKLPNGNLLNGDAMGSVIFGGSVNNLESQLSLIGSSYKGNGVTNFSDLHFVTSQMTRMLIDSIGNVGIGTSSPKTKLHIYSGDVLFGKNTTSGTFHSGTATNDAIYFQNGNTNFPYLGIQMSRPEACNVYLGKNKAVAPGGSVAGQGFLAFLISGSNVGTISVNASESGVVYNTTSDKRLKENIVNTHFGLADLIKISVKDYNFKSDETKTVQTGFLAQDLYEVYPEAVSVGGENAQENPWGVDYGKLTPLLVKAIQDQQKMIDELKKEVESLKKAQ